MKYFKQMRFVRLSQGDHDAFTGKESYLGKSRTVGSCISARQEVRGCGGGEGEIPKMLSRLRGRDKLTGHKNVSQKKGV